MGRSQPMTSTVKLSDGRQDTDIAGSLERWIFGIGVLDRAKSKCSLHLNETSRKINIQLSTKKNYQHLIKLTYICDKCWCNMNRYLNCQVGLLDKQTALFEFNMRMDSRLGLIILLAAFL